MRPIKTTGLCLAAVCAISGAVVSSASAAPEFFSKGKVITKAVSYTNVSTKTPLLLGGVKIECKGGDTGKGKIAPPNKTEKLKLVYTGCKGGIGTEKVGCQKSASKKELIQTENLKGQLVMASKTEGGSQVISTELESEKPSELEAKFTCGTLKVEVKGKILTEPTPIGVESPTGLETNNSKAEIGACSEQDLLYVNGTGPCVHLFTAAGSAANESQDKVTFKTSKSLPGIEIHP